MNQKKAAARPVVERTAAFSVIGPQPPVSVCLPTFNRARYLAGAIENVLAQTFGDFEVVVCDNASTDETTEVAESFGDPRVRYLRNDRNIGLAANWAKAVSLATGRYCVIISDDDRWAPSFLERLTAPLDADPSVDVAFCDHWVIDAAGNVLTEASDRYSRSYGRASLPPGRHKPFLDLALHSQAFLTAGSLIRRERIHELAALDARAGRVLDYYLFALLALGGGGAFYVPDRLAYYRVHGQSSSELHQVQVWRDVQWVCASLARQVPRGRHAARIRQRWARALASEGMALLKERDRTDAVRALLRSVRMVPLTARPWLGLAAAVTIGSWRPFRRRALGEEA